MARNDHYRLTIKRIASRSEDSQAASGLVSTYFHDRLAVGDRIEAKAPSGTFTIDVTQHKKLGWTPGQNIDLDYHWPGAQTARVHAVADEIVLSDFKEKHKGEKSESVAALLTRAAEEGDEEAISLLAAGALERRV